MSDIKPPVSLRGLLRESQRVEVPLIQRDYAQGRESEIDIRSGFLDALRESLLLPREDARLPLNLDFVYGTAELGPDSRFLPLDGQQRLTTLFLLHWYLAWRDRQLANFKDMMLDGKRSRFAYSVRPSSTEFFDALVNFAPQDTPGKVGSVRRLLEDQPWFFLHWRLDPTIQSALTMLDAIHERFGEFEGLYARLVDDEKPAITFHLLPLEHFGLSDDLYIKMNARGKPLTPFETFKARFEELLKELFPSGTRFIGSAKLPIPTFFERRMDTQWTDFFWNNGPKTVDSGALNLAWALVHVSLDPKSASFAADTTSLGKSSLGASFTLFHERNWLTAKFADHWMDLLEAWSADGIGLAAQLPDGRYLNEAALFRKASEEPHSLTYFQLIQFAALVAYLSYNRGPVQKNALHQWMRVITNLAANSDIERPEEFRRSLAGVQQLLPEGNRILDRLAEGKLDVSGFATHQLREEELKARLILANDGWIRRIECAEVHGYFSGQIDFLLAFAGATDEAIGSPSDWDQGQHTTLQANFDEYLAKAQLMFGSSGLAAEGRSNAKHLWRRALLSIGDYLPSFGHNHSFLTNQQRHWTSWKRFLRDGSNDKRQFLKALWDRIDINADLDPQLEGIIGSAAGLEPWRVAIVGHPEAISYCGQQEILREGSDTVYLLSKQQMSGYHAELFSYVLSLQLAARDTREILPLRYYRYESVYGRDLEPHVLLELSSTICLAYFTIKSANGQFQIGASSSELAALPEVEVTLLSEGKFTKESGRLTRMVPRADIHEVLRQIAQSLAKLSIK